jgi:hypothetical protein
MSGGLWSVVGYGDDPIPDDPGIVAAQVAHIRAVAADIKAQVDALPTDGAIDEVPWESETGAPSEFKAVCKKLPKDLDKLRTRYAKVGDAMAEFQVWLANTKGQAQDNLTIATAAHNEIVAAQAGVAQMKDFSAQAQSQASRQNAAAKPGTPPVTPAPWTGPDYGAQLSQAQATFNQAKATIDHAVTQFHQASQTAAQAVSAASNDSLKNDTSLFGSIVNAVESFGHWVASNVPLSAISGILTKIAAVAGILSLIPGLGLIFGSIALAAASLAFVCDLINTINDAYEGDLSWHDALTLGIDLVSVVASGVAVGAEVASRGAEAAAEAAKASSTSADAAAQAATTAKVDAQAAADADQQALANIRGGNILQRAVSRVTGATGRAETALENSQDTLASAQNAEMRALDAARTAQAAKQATHTIAVGAKATALNANLLSNVVGAGGLVNSIGGEHVVSPAVAIGMALPMAQGPGVAVSMVRSTSLEVRQLLQGSEDPTGKAAAATGAALKAQPIPVPAGRTAGAARP